LTPSLSLTKDGRMI